MLSSRVRSRASSRAVFLLALMSVLIEMYFSIAPVPSMKGAMKVSTQYRLASLARLQTSPRHGVPLSMVRHISAQKLSGCTPEPTVWWLRLSNSARE